MAEYPGNRRMEIDLLVVSPHDVVLIEAESKLNKEDVQEHLERLAQFKAFYPEYADKRIMGAVAGIVVDEKVNRFAIEAGLFVIVQSGDTVRLDNPTDFVPRTW